jgi:hypothetical protein
MCFSFLQKLLGSNSVVCEKASRVALKLGGNDANALGSHSIDTQVTPNFGNHDQRCNHNPQHEEAGNNNPGNGSNAHDGSPPRWREQ